MHRGGHSRHFFRAFFVRVRKMRCIYAHKNLRPLRTSSPKEKGPECGRAEIYSRFLHVRIQELFLLPPSISRVRVKDLPLGERPGGRRSLPWERVV